MTTVIAQSEHKYLYNQNCTVVHNVCTLSSRIKLDTLGYFVTICKY